MTEAWRFVQTVLFITHTETPRGRQKNPDGGHWSERRDGEIVDPGEEQRGFKENTRMMDMKELLIALGSHTSDADCQTGCKCYSEHSLRPRLLFLNLSAYTQTHCISTSHSLRLQYPLFCFEDVRKSINSREVLLWFPFPERLRKRRVMRQDGRWWTGMRRKVVLMGGICHRTQRGGWKGARLSRRTKQMEISRSWAKSAEIWHFKNCLRKYSILLPPSAAASPVACRHMRRMAICLFSFCRMSKRRRRKMGGRDNVTGVVVRVVFLETISQKLFVKTHFSHCSQLRKGGGRTQIKYDPSNYIIVLVCF